MGSSNGFPDSIHHFLRLVEYFIVAESKDRKSHGRKQSVTLRIGVPLLVVYWSIDFDNKARLDGVEVGD